VLPLAITILAITWVVGLLTSLVGPNTFLGDLLRTCFKIAAE